MSICTLEHKKIGINFVKAIKLGLFKGSLNVTNLESTISSSLNKKEFDPLVMASTIYASAKIKGSAIEGLLALETADAIKAYANDVNNADPNIDGVQRTLDALGSIKGFSTFNEAVETLGRYGVVETVTISNHNEVYHETALLTAADGILVNADAEFVEEIDIKDPATAMLLRKSKRIVRTKDIKATAKDFWVPFLSTYFPGMSGVSSDFVVWVKDKVYSAIVDNTATRGGFATDINTVMRTLKKEIEVNVSLARNNTPYNADVMSSSLLNSDGAKKDRYFNEVLSTDFDFVLQNMLKTVAISNKLTKENNSVVSGFITFRGEESEDVVLNTKGIKDLIVRVNGNKYMLRAAKNGVEIPKMILNVDLDTTTFLADTSKAGNAFYKTTLDGKYFFKDGAGRVIDISPIPYYEYNTKNKGNSSSIDHAVGPFDLDTAFVQNLLHMFKQVVVDENGQLKLSEKRMDKVDYLTVANYLTNAGSKLEEFIPALRAIGSEKDSNAGRIANSIYVHLFSPTPTFMGDGTVIYSIFQAMKANGNTRGNINNAIITALHSALISKDNNRYLLDKDNVTIVTKGIDTGSEAGTVDNALAEVLMKDGYTKAAIGEALIVSNKKVSVKLSRDTRETLVSLNAIVTIPDAVEVAEALGISKMFSDIQTQFRSSYANSNAADRATLATFINILTIAANNKKTNYLRATSEDVEDRFLNPLFIRKAPSTVISGNELKNLALLYNVNSHKSILVGGEMTASTSPVSRNSRFSFQIKNIEDYNVRVNAVKFNSNPFLSSVVEDIPKATFTGMVTKTAKEVQGVITPLASWNEKMRIEHAIIQGMIKSAKNVGQDMLIQPVAYSDKSNIELAEIYTNENLLANTELMSNRLRQAFITYSAMKNEEIQRIMIHSLKEFIVGNYSSLYAEISREVDSVERLEALKELRVLLMRDFSTSQGDFTKPINLLLEKVRINPDRIEFSDTNLDMGSDIISMPGNPGTALLKPHLGVRAELYRDPVRAEREVDTILQDHKNYLDSLKIDSLMFLYQITKCLITNMIQGRCTTST